MNNRFNKLRMCILALASTGLLFSCTDENNPIIETPPVEDAFMEIDGGGSTFPNMSFVKLSTENQKTVTRSTWDLAFSSSSEFKVLINGTTGAMAYKTDFNSFDELDESYVEKLRTDGVLLLDFNNMNSILYVDDPKNPIANGTAIGSIANTESESKVIVYQRGKGGVEEREWQKLRVFKSGVKYILQYAPIASEDYTTVEITKDSDFNFVYFSLDSGKVEVEPKKNDWDFVWTAGTSSTPFPQAANGTLGYFFQDLVYHNIYGGVGAAVVMEEFKAYENFEETDLAGITFNTDDRLTIGSSWRSGGGPNASPAVREDRYYLLKDNKGNIYKLRFLSLTSGGERGRPSLEYALVKSGS
ncbi:HmuY family protein [Mongoliibacter ruber]|uniref:Heme-binding HmuY-like protein n=1 Tax=Mongoliibacter ruber TaxID=1750599 RepID=A0A2T0WD92_9BACT|nr:HmuY family protein [Mongoliibacter ruber]PRY84635.1 heme-binding HmuY-like protein [Mongoliibacter ruber]